MCQYGKGFAENSVYIKTAGLGAQTVKDKVITIVAVIQRTVDAADGGS